MMEQPDMVFNQCRFCLRLIEPLSSFLIFGDSDEDSDDPQLTDFVQKMLSIEFTAENSHVCSDCFSMWRLIQDFLHACAEAHKIILSSREFVVRKPWLEGDEEKRMLIDVCRLVKKMHHEMKILHCTVVYSPEVELNAKPAKAKYVRGKYRKHKQPVDSGNAKMKKMEPPNEILNDAIKEEDPVDIDDSEAFQTDKPIEATKAATVESDRPAQEETAADKENQVSPGNDDDNLIMDDSISIVEPQVDQIDLIDSSDEEADAGTEIRSNCVEDVISVASSWREIKQASHEEKFKTVCQLCGITTKDMANHLESHIADSKTADDEQNQSDSDDSESSSSSDNSSRSSNSHIRQPKPLARQENKDKRPTVAVEEGPNPLKCSVCGVQFASLLTAKLHARLHPVRPRGYPAQAIKSNNIVRKKS